MRHVFLGFLVIVMAGTLREKWMAITQAVAGSILVILGLVRWIKEPPKSIPPKLSSKK